MTYSEAERAIVEEAKFGSKVAFGKLIDAHQQAVRAFLRRLNGRWAEADDIAQDVFISAWVQLHRFDVRRSFRSWLFGMAYRKYLMTQRALFRRWRRDMLSVDYSDVDEFHLATDARLDLL